VTTVVLGPGERIRIELFEADGAFEVTYGRRELTVTTDMPGSHLGGEGLIYREVYDGCTCGEVAEPPDARCPEHGKYALKDIVGGEEEIASQFQAVRVGPERWEVRPRQGTIGPLVIFQGRDAEDAADAWAAILEGVPEPVTLDGISRHFQPKA
jgi:hypothetical protein